MHRTTFHYSVPAKPPNSASGHGIDVERTFEVLFEEDETGWFTASVPALPGCHTQGRTLAQAKQRIQEALQAYLTVRPDAPVHTRFVGIDRVSVSV